MLVPRDSRHRHLYIHHHHHILHSIIMLIKRGQLIGMHSNILNIMEDHRHRVRHLLGMLMRTLLHIKRTQLRPLRLLPRLLRRGIQRKDPLLKVELLQLRQWDQRVLLLFLHITTILLTAAVFLNLPQDHIVILILP